MNYKQILGKITAVILCLVMVFGTTSVTAEAAAYDPASEYETLDIKFLTDKPETGFYINAAAKWDLENIPELNFGTTAGEWTAMDLMRGMYLGADYINDIPNDYFEKYITVFEQKLIDTKGTLHRVKYTEYSRLILALSCLDYDAHNVAPHYRSGDYKSDVVEEGTPNAKLYSYDLPLRYSVSNSTLYKQGINGPIWTLIALNTCGYKFYTKDELQAGIDGENAEIADKLAAFGITSLEAEAKTVSATTGKTSQYKGIATEGKQIEYILDKEITQEDGTVGGWSLTGKNPDPDITGMALQALAPYYLSEERFNAAKENAYYDDDLSLPYTYNDLKQAVERAVYVMSEKQLNNGGFSSWGSTNSESVAQIIVALTELGIDPLAETVSLPAINKTCSFIKPGEERDGVVTNNMIDNIISFWAKGSGSTADIGGFKHVTTGNDGGGGAGTTVNPMATDQTLYALIAYDRFTKGENSLYNMTDMANKKYKTLKAKKLTLTYDGNNVAPGTTTDFSPYEVITLATLDDTDEHVFVGWNTKADGSGKAYDAGDEISMPSSDATLYANWSIKAEAIEKVNNVIDKIDAIGNVDLNSADKIAEAREAYDQLPDSLKKLVTNYETLIKAEEKMEELISSSEKEDDNTPATTEKEDNALAADKNDNANQIDSELSSPKTGDSGNIFIWLICCIASALSIVLLQTRKHRKVIK